MNNKLILSIDVTSPHSESRFEIVTVSRKETRHLVFCDIIEFDNALKNAKDLLRKNELICIRTVRSTEFQDVFILSEDPEDEI